MTTPPRFYRSLTIFSVLSVLYTLSMFYRVSNAVIAPNLIQDLGLDAERLGILGGAFFYSFALFQIPMGPMLDRIGPRVIITASTMIGAAGAFLFARGESFAAAISGRILIGMGMSSILMGSLKVFTLEFPPEKFSTLMGTIISVGSLGSILAASPLAYLASTIGWRVTFAFASGMTAFLGFLTFSILGGKNKHPIAYRSSDPGIGIFQSIRLVLGSLAFWQIGTVAFFRFGISMGLQGLWLGPYLINIKGYSPVEAGNLLILLAMGIIVGGPIAGRLSDQTFRSSKALALWGMGLYSASLVPLTGVINFSNPFWDGLLLFSMGFFNSFGILTYSHAKQLFPVFMSGTVITWVNFFTIAGAAIFMPALGRVIESFPRIGHAYPAQAYHLSFLICCLGMLVSLVFYGFSKERKGDPGTGRHGE